LTSFDHHCDRVDCVYIESSFLDITVELDAVEMVYYFFNLVEVSFVTILVSIDQDIVSISASKQIS
jgi:hypothetical protein